MDCVSNKNREMTSLDILEGHIDKGTPPNAVGTEYNNEGIIRTVFRWKCGTFLYMRYELSAYLITLARFMDFWGTCLPGSEFEVKEKEGGKSGGH
jgi:hypothetical protein